MSKSIITEAELISILKHSSLPTLLTEGKDDLVLLRRLEDTYADVGLSVLPAGGRDLVLKVYARKDEISAEKIVLFMADRDTWIYSEIPSQYCHPSVFFTEGYSIENDLYRDGDLERLLLPRERKIFMCELDRFLTWYSLALSRHLNDRSVEIAVHPTTLLASDEHYTFACNLHAGEVFPQELREHIRKDYCRLVRGKSLLSLILRQLSAASRSTKYSAKALLEIGATNGGRHVARISQWLSGQLGRQT